MISEEEQKEIDLLHRKLEWYESHCVAVIDDNSSRYWTLLGYAVPIRNFEGEADAARQQLGWSIQRERELEQKLRKILAKT